MGVVDESECKSEVAASKSPTDNDTEVESDTQVAEVESDNLVTEVASDNLVAEEGGAEDDLNQRLAPLLEIMSSIYALESQIEEAAAEDDFDTAESLDAEATDLKNQISAATDDDPALKSALDAALADR